MAESTDPARLTGIPAAKPPPSVVPNHVNPSSSGYRLITIGSILLAIMLLCVYMRIYTKIKIVKKTSSDDCEPS